MINSSLHPKGTSSGCLRHPSGREHPTPLRGYESVKNNPVIASTARQSFSAWRQVKQIAALCSQ